MGNAQRSLVPKKRVDEVKQGVKERRPGAGFRQKQVASQREPMQGTDAEEQFMEAVEAADLWRVEVMLEGKHGMPKVDVNAGGYRNMNGETIMMAACKATYIVKGAGPMVKGKNIENAAKIIKLLLAKKANLEGEDTRKRNVIETLRIEVNKKPAWWFVAKVFLAETYAMGERDLLERQEWGEEKLEVLRKTRKEMMAVGERDVAIGKRIAGAEGWDVFDVMLKIEELIAQGVLQENPY